MAQQLRNLCQHFSIILLFFVIIPCYSSSISRVPYDSRAYPASYSSTTVDGEFKDLIGELGNVFSLKSFDGVGTISTSAKTVLNVDDFGAKGDGIHDDTQV